MYDLSGTTANENIKDISKVIIMMFIQTWSFLGRWTRIRIMLKFKMVKLYNNIDVKIKIIHFKIINFNVKFVLKSFKFE